MVNQDDFVDYYDLLKVNRDASPRTLEVAYHYYAKLYHPDSHETANVDSFAAVIEAYKILRDPEERAKYDEKHAAIVGVRDNAFFLDDDMGISEGTAIGDAEIHAKILRQLYKRRRECVSEAGIAGWLLQEALGCSDDELDFHVWYLTSKGLLNKTEQGTLAITIEGVDHVIATSQGAKAAKLLIEQSDMPAPQA
tara:strand:- start:26 stop:610 length:585 start_codon:yes stop_codon:yes gene_type:complete